jgi:predicted nucleotide-binding protein
MSISYFRPSCTVEVGAPTRSEVEHIFEIFEKGAPKCQVATSSLTVQEINAFKPVIFIGHGRSPIWRDLKDHLHEQHGYDVQAYEIGSRAGHAIRDILEDMLETSLFAILVMTAEDKIRSGHMRARQNVVHELGLFQGKLGFSKAIILLERGVQEFSNIHGIHQIRFSKKNIKETYGDVLATLRREFGQSQSENEDS